MNCLSYHFFNTLINFVVTKLPKICSGYPVHVTPSKLLPTNLEVMLRYSYNVMRRPLGLSSADLLADCSVRVMMFELPASAVI